MKLPSFQFYPGDWLKDNVSGCTLAAQGLWLRMLLLAHESDRRGYLSVNGKPMQPEFLARKCGCDNTAQFLTLYTELSDAGVPSQQPDGTIYSRRMVRDENKRRKCSDAGKLGGGNPELSTGTFKGGSKGSPKGESKGSPKRFPKASTSSSSSEKEKAASCLKESLAAAAISENEFLEIIRKVVAIRASTGNVRSLASYEGKLIDDFLRNPLEIELWRRQIAEADEKDAHNAIKRELRQKQYQEELDLISENEEKEQILEKFRLLPEQKQNHMRHEAEMRVSDRLHITNQWVPVTLIEAEIVEMMKAGISEVDASPQKKCLPNEKRLKSKSHGNSSISDTLGANGTKDMESMKGDDGVSGYDPMPRHRSQDKPNIGCKVGGPTNEGVEIESQSFLEKKSQKSQDDISFLASKLRRGEFQDFDKVVETLCGDDEHLAMEAMADAWAEAFDCSEVLLATFLQEYLVAN